MIKRLLITIFLALSLSWPNTSIASLMDILNIGAGILGGITENPKNYPERRLKKQNRKVKECVKELYDVNKNLTWRLNECNATK